MKKIKIFTIVRTDSVQYDEYAGAVVAATNEEEAIELSPLSYKDKRDLKITEEGVSIRKLKGIILTDYKAG